MRALQSDLDHLQWIKEAKVESLKGMRILDLGCGSGYVCHKAISDGAATAVGIDVVRPEIPSGGTNGWQFMSTDLNARNWHESFNEQFDLVLAFDIIEHLDSPFLFLSSCRKLLVDSGRLVLTTPNALSWERFAKPLSWSGATDPQHKVLFTKYSLDFLLNRVGFRSNYMSAPMRSLSFLGALQPQVGGQILCVAE